MGSKKIAYGEQEQLERDWIVFNKRKAVLEQWKKCCKLAYKIAMLPERGIEDYV